MDKADSLGKEREGGGRFAVARTRRKSVKRIFFMVVVFLCLSWWEVRAEEDQKYLRYLSDIPILERGEELEEQAIFFDKAEGRVVEEVIFVPHFDQKKIKNFYTATLPALGWEASLSDHFLRNGEQLVVKIEKADGGFFVRFALSPETN